MQLERHQYWWLAMETTAPTHYRHDVNQKHWHIDVGWMGSVRIPRQPAWHRTNTPHHRHTPGLVPTVGLQPDAAVVLRARLGEQLGEERAAGTPGKADVAQRTRQDVGAGEPTWGIPRDFDAREGADGLHGR